MDIADDILVPTRYILSDSDDDEYYPEPPTPSTASQIAVKLDPKFPHDEQWTLIVGAYGGGNTLLNAVREDEKEVAGIVIVPGVDLKQNSFDLFSPQNAGFVLHRHTKSAEPTLLLPCNSSLTASQSVRFVRTIYDHINIQRTIILDTILPSEYTLRTPHLRPPHLRTLHTTTTQKIQSLAIYEPPNLTKSVTAAFLAYCEIHAQYAYALLSLRENGYTVGGECLSALGAGLEVFGLQMGFEIAKEVGKGTGNNKGEGLYL